MLIIFFSCSPNVTLATGSNILHCFGVPSGVEVNSHHVTAAPWAKGLVAEISRRTPGFDPNPVYVGFVVDRMILVKDFL